MTTPSAPRSSEQPKNMCPTCAGLNPACPYVAPAGEEDAYVQWVACAYRPPAAPAVEEKVKCPRCGKETDGSGAHTCKKRPELEEAWETFEPNEETPAAPDISATGKPEWNGAELVREAASCVEAEARERYTHPSQKPKLDLEMRFADALRKLADKLGATTGEAEATESARREGRRIFVTASGQRSYETVESANAKHEAEFREALERYADTVIERENLGGVLSFSEVVTRQAEVKSEVLRLYQEKK